MSTPDYALLQQAKSLCQQIISTGLLVEGMQLEQTIEQINTSSLPVRHRLHLICALKEAQAGVSRKTRKSIRQHINAL